MAKGCEIVTGFLIRHPCDYPPTAQCSLCGKYICDRHTRQLSDLDQTGAPPQGQVSPGGVACVECVRQTVQQSQARTRWVDDPYFWGMYHSTYYRPYSLHDHYDQRDQAAFEQPDAGAAAGAYESDLSGT